MVVVVFVVSVSAAEMSSSDSSTAIDEDGDGGVDEDHNRVVVVNATVWRRRRIPEFDSTKSIDDDDAEARFACCCGTRTKARTGKEESIPNTDMRSNVKTTDVMAIKGEERRRRRGTTTTAFAMCDAQRQRAFCHAQ